jgi:Fe-S oxidoreductase
VPIVGLEPSCLLTLRDELLSIAECPPQVAENGAPGPQKPANDSGNPSLRQQITDGASDSSDARAVAAHALLFEEFLAREAQAGRLVLPLKPIAEKALVHGHCHQKAFDAFQPVVDVLKLVPGLEVETVESSCCGMAGAFGYGADTYEVSMAMGELSLLPAVRKADAGTLIVADGTSCRHQIADGARRHAVHVARVLADSLRR